jgi:hypothetical protein
MANYYLQISPINTLSTSTYSIYFNEIRDSNLMLSGVAQSILTAGFLVYFTGSAAAATSVIVKNEDPECCCSAQSYTFPTPTPTSTPTVTPTSTPTSTPLNTPTNTPNSTPTNTPLAATPTNTPLAATPTNTPSENYTLTLTGGSGINSIYELGGTFNTSDVVVVSASFSGFGGTVPSPHNGRADLTLFNSSAGVSDTDVSSCVSVGGTLTYNITSLITFPYSVANATFGTVAVVNNGTASSSTLTVYLVSVNGIPVSGVSVVGNKNNQSGNVCGP